jgi:hypothetical protein
VYTNDSADPDQALTATTNNGGAMITQVPPGTYDIKVSSGSYPNCGIQHGGGNAPSAAGQSFKINAIAGADVVAFVLCKP